MGRNGKRRAERHDDKRCSVCDARGGPLGPLEVAFDGGEPVEALPAGAVLCWRCAVTAAEYAWSCVEHQGAFVAPLCLEEIALALLETRLPRRVRQRVEDALGGGDLRFRCRCPDCDAVGRAVLALFDAGGDCPCPGCSAEREAARRRLH